MTRSSAPAPSSAHERPLLLLVEDDPSTHTALKMLMNRRGWDVILATTLADAHNLLDRKPAAMILDLMLPDGSGVALLQRLRDEKVPLHVVVTTGVSDPDRLKEVRDLNPAAMLFKPINIRDLEKHLNPGDFSR